MSQTEELLNSLSSDDISTYLANAEEEPHIVIGNDRIITVPESLKRIAVQYDHNVETVTFDCPRYWDGLDMSKMVVYINYKLPNRILGSYVADNVAVDESDTNLMHFTWTISRNVTGTEGNISFLVCIKKRIAMETRRTIGTQNLIILSMCPKVWKQPRQLPNRILTLLLICLFELVIWKLSLLQKLKAG